MNLLILASGALHASAFQSWDISAPCNGAPGNCHLSLDQVTFVGHHNAAAVGLEVEKLGLSVNAGCLTDNHHYEIPAVLQRGLRFFDIDTCKVTGDEKQPYMIRNCHGPSVGRLFKDIMQEIGDWLDMPTRSREVVVISLGDANPGVDTQEHKNEMAVMIAKDLEETVGHLMYRPRSDGKWPTIGEMVKLNSRVVVVWGKRLWYALYMTDKANSTEDYTSKYVRELGPWVHTWKEAYGSYNVNDLKSYLDGFCEDNANFPKDQQLVFVDEYLTLGMRASTSYCNVDLAAEVNPAILAGNVLENNQLLSMQESCWKNNKRVSIVAMDYAETFADNFLDTTGRALNDRNFARFGWVGGILKLGAPSNSGEDGSLDVSSPESLKSFLGKLPGLEVTNRIEIDEVKKDKDGGATVRFSILARKGQELSEASNAEVLKAMKASVVQGKSSYSNIEVLAECPDPGHPAMGVRYPDPDLGFDEGARVEFFCEFGHMNTGGDMERICGADGMLTGIQPQCGLFYLYAKMYIPLWAQILIVVGAVIFLILLVICVPRCWRCTQHRIRLFAFQSVFGNLDSHQHGFVDKEELLEALDTMDTDHNGRIEFHEFLRAVDAPVGHPETSGTCCRRCRCPCAHDSESDWEKMDEEFAQKYEAEQKRTSRDVQLKLMR